MKLDVIIGIVIFTIIDGILGHIQQKHTDDDNPQPKRYSESNIVTTQNAAAKQAATQVKAILAQKAINAATTAKAALVGKECLVEELLKRVREAEISLTEQDCRLQQARNSAEMSYNNVLKKQQEVERLNHALSSTRLNLAAAQKDARCASERYDSLATVIEASKEKYSYLLIELQSAKMDLEATRGAARRAEAAADAAKANINTPELCLPAECGNKETGTIDVKVNCPVRSAGSNFKKKKKIRE